MPRTFLLREAKWFPEGSLAEIPDIEADRDAYDIRRFDLEPGDAIFFDFLSVHGAPGYPFSGRRRGLSLRYLAPAARAAPRGGRTSPPCVGRALAAARQSASAAAAGRAGPRRSGLCSGAGRARPRRPGRSSSAAAALSPGRAAGRPAPRPRT